MNNREIWTFVENQLNCTVPEYIKNVLEVCGYANGITIATIDQDDIKYFEDEVKNGNVSKHFGDEKDALAGSNKTIDNFEFVRGHVKLLMQIKDFLKSHMDANGPEFIMRANTNDKAKAPEELVDEGKNKRGLKRKNDSKNGVVKSIFAIDGTKFSKEDDNKHREVIYIKMLKALNELTADTLSKAKQKISPDLVQVQVIAKKSSKSEDEPSDEENIVHTLVGDVICIYCAQPIRVFYEPSERNAFLWKTSNWNRHLSIVHKGEKNGNSKNIQKGNDKAIGETESRIRSKDNEKAASSSMSSQIVSVASDTEATELEPEPSNIVSNKSTIDISVVEPAQNDTNVEIKNDGNYQRSRVHNQSISIPSCSKTSEPNMAFYGIVNYSDSSDDEDDDATDLSGSKKDLPDLHTENKIERVSELKTIDVDQPDANKTNEAATAASIPIIRNGYSSTDKKGKQTLVTRNTCSFDSIFSIYVCLCFDDVEFRELFTTLSKKSSFAMLVQSYHSLFSSQARADPTELSNLYADRNTILMEVFTKSTYHLNTNVKKRDDLLFIDCNTGIGKLFGQICAGVCPYIASAVEIKTCESCKNKSRTVLPFIAVAVNGVDLCNIQKSICPLKSKGRCNACKGKCIVNLSYNNVLVLEVEPNTTVKNQKKISIANLSQTIVVGKNFHLRAIIEYDPKIRHFKSHIKRVNGIWITYDDIQHAENKIEEFEEVLPYMLFYVTSEFDDEFLNAWLVKLSKNSALPNKSSLRATSKDTAENKWKY